jgi:hypothetical protein
MAFSFSFFHVLVMVVVLEFEPRDRQAINHWSHDPRLFALVNLAVIPRPAWTATLLTYTSHISV